MNHNNEIAREWDELDFYYEFDSDFMQWRFFGSKNGLKKIPEIIRRFAKDQSNEGISEHIHVGPYSYLKIMTWHERVITKDYLAGSLNDLLFLAQIIHDAIEYNNTGYLVKIFDQYSIKSTASLLFFIMADDFRPSSIEF